MKIMIETDNKEFIKALRAMAKIANVEVKSSKNKLKAAIEEAKDIESNPHKYKSYDNARDMIRDCLK